MLHLRWVTTPTYRSTIDAIDAQVTVQSHTSAVNKPFHHATVLSNVTLRIIRSDSSIVIGADFP